MRLIGRIKECEILDGLLVDARQGLSRTLVLFGDTGVGKSALVDYIAQSAPGFRVARVGGVETEEDLAFAALQRLLLTFHNGMGQLPTRQREALSVSLGLNEGNAANPSLVGLGTLNLLAEAATTQPLLVCIDDTQWLDDASLRILGFVARRVLAEGIVMIFTVRTGDGPLGLLEGIPAIEVAGLDETSALALLHSVATNPIEPRIAERVVIATGGNPLALKDLGLELSSQQLVGGTLLPEPIPVGEHLQRHYVRTVRALPRATQAWLLIAAAEPSGNHGYVSAAASQMGIDADSPDPAEAAGIVDLRRGIEFRHPLIRSAIYNSATTSERHRVHQALAEAISTPEAADRRTWHLAAAATEPNEEVARLLEQAGERASGLGCYVARASYLIKAAEITPDDQIRNRRVLAAAEAAFRGGALVQSRSLLERVEIRVEDPWAAGRATMLEARVALMTGDPGAFGVAPAKCLAASTLFGNKRRDDAREALFLACKQSIPAERLIRGTSAAEIAETVEDMGLADHSTTLGLFLAAYGALIRSGYDQAVPEISRAITALLAGEASDEEFLDQYILGVTLSMMIWDDEAHLRILERAVKLSRNTGALEVLDTALFSLSMAETILGNLERADAYSAEGSQVRSALGISPPQSQIYRHPELIAWRGESAHTREAFGDIELAADYLGVGAMVSIARIGSMILEMGQGRYPEACAIASDLVLHDDLGVHSRVLPDLIESAVRCGQQQLARDALATLEIRAKASGTARALGVLARSQALLAATDEAEALFEESVRKLTDAPGRTDLARAHLLYGEWLRRAKRRKDARTQLRFALDIFEEIGASDFAERTRAELDATGETARKRSEDTYRDLTPQEEQVARLAARGDTNKEIGTRLFISARTVDYHLRKVYQKLGVGSRRDLRGTFN